MIFTRQRTLTARTTRLLLLFFLLFTITTTLACEFDLWVFDSCTDTTAIQTPDDSGTLITDGNCHSIGINSPYPFPGYYRATCTDGAIQFLVAGCRDAQCQFCQKSASNAESLYASVEGGVLIYPPLVVTEPGQGLRYGCQTWSSHLGVTIHFQAYGTCRAAEQCGSSSGNGSSSGISVVETITGAPITGAPLSAPPTRSPISAFPTRSPVSARPTGAPVTGAPTTMEPTAAPVTTPTTERPTMMETTLLPSLDSAPSGLVGVRPAVAPTLAPVLGSAPLGATPTTSTTEQETTTTTNDSSSIVVPLAAAGGSVAAFLVGVLVAVLVLLRRRRQPYTLSNASKSGLHNNNKSGPPETTPPNNTTTSTTLDDMPGASANDIIVSLERSQSDGLSTLGGYTGLMEDGAMQDGVYDDPTVSVNIDFDYDRNEYKQSTSGGDRSTAISTTDFSKVSALGNMVLDDDHSLEQQLCYDDDGVLVAAAEAANSNTLSVVVPPGRLGMVLDDDKKKKVVVVRALQPGSALARQGVRVGYGLVGVDGETVTRWSATKVSQRLTERADHSRRLVFQRSTTA